MRWLMVVAALVVAALAVAGPAGAVEDVDGSFAKLPRPVQSAIETALDLAVADGPSSRIRQVRVPNQQYDPTSICLLANMKNKFGAYIGYQSVYFDAETMRIYIHPDMAEADADFRARHDRICR